MPTDTRVGTVIGGYRLQERIGHGATSVVYRAEHIRLNRDAALKLLTPGLGDADFSERFVRESRLAASLQHPNIVPVYDAGEENGVLYIAMAFVRGRDLRAVLTEEGALGLPRTLRIATQVASALDAAHAAGLVHRDVKPANILIGESDTALLTDFGAVKEATGEGVTRSGGFLGTVGYAAPEQIEAGEVDARTDVYALACVTWECLTGSPPFQRASDIATLHAHLHDPLPRLRNLQPELPGTLESVLGRGLAKSPLDRFATAGELAAAARSAARTLRVDKSRLGLAAAALAAAALIGIAAGAAIGLGAGGGARTDTETETVARTITAGPTYDGHELDAAAYALMQDGQYAAALPFAEAAVRALSGLGPKDPYEGFAAFNLGKILINLDRCDEALPFLRRARTLQPKSKTVASALDRAHACSRAPK